MSDLRSRIAAALEMADKTPLPFDDGPVGYDHLADAVIRELQLRPEWGALDGEDNGTLADTREELKPWPGETVKCRYITGWANHHD